MSRILWLTRLLSGLAIWGVLLVSCGSSGADRASPKGLESGGMAEPGAGCPEGAKCGAEGRARLDCPTGKADCDEDATNGCETAVSSDPLNCRFCGQACETNFACIDSVCRQLAPSISAKQADGGARKSSATP